MFGKHLEPAEATVLFVELSSRHHMYDFILDVRTASGQVFRADTKQEFIPFTHPEVGDVVKVKYNPKNMKVELDLKGDPRYDAKAREAAAKARHDAILSGQPGTPLPPDQSTAAFQGSFQSIDEAGAALNIDLNEIMHKALSGNAFPSGSTVIHVEKNGQTLDPNALSGLGIDLNEIMNKAFSGNAFTSGTTVVQMGGNGQTLNSSGTPGQEQGGQAQAAYMQSQQLRAELQSSGTTASATILYVEDTGMTFPPFVSRKIMVRVQEASSYQVFDSTFVAWIDNTRTTLLTPGASIIVRYDPTDHNKIILSQ